MYVLVKPSIPTAEPSKLEIPRFFPKSLNSFSLNEMDGGHPTKTYSIACLLLLFLIFFFCFCFYSFHCLQTIWHSTNLNINLSQPKKSP